MPALPDDLTRAENIARGFGTARDQSARLIDAEQINTLRSAVNLMARQGEELASMVARMLTPAPSSDAPGPEDFYLIDDAPLGSVERLNQELAAALARNAELQETLTEIRNALRAWDSYDPGETSASIVGRLIDRTRVLHTQIDRAYEELRPFALTQPPL